MARCCASKRRSTSELVTPTRAVAGRTEQLSSRASAAAAGAVARRWTGIAMRGWTAHARGIATQPVAARHGSDGDDGGGGHGGSAGSDGSSGAAMRPASWPGWSYVAQPDRAAGPG